MAYSSSHSRKRYLRQLYELAEEYIEDEDLDYDPVEHFYRNKSKTYFRNVKANGNVMETILKDCNGDPKSPINGRLEGVFFGVSLRNGELPDSSPFGNTRICVPVEALFHEDTNLYFTDFYCTTSYTHYVTLVLADRHSDADKFCQRKLLKLDHRTNQFLRRRKKRYTVIDAPKLIVEVFYTEDVDIDELMTEYGRDQVFFTTTDIIGKGHSTRGGLRKDENCDDCNPSC